jgi:hypothetical protein
MGGTSITSGVAVANSDWSDFISVSAVDLTNGINYAADVRWSSSTDRVYMGFLDARGTGRGLRSILCRGVGTAFACPSGALSTLSAYNSDTSTLVTNNITLPSGVPNVGTTTTYTLTTEPNGDCW